MTNCNLVGILDGLLEQEKRTLGKTKEICMNYGL